MAVELVAPVVVAPAAAGATSRVSMRVLVVWMTCALDGRDHAVTDERAAEAMSRGDGMYDAVCDRRIAPLSLTCEAGPWCTECLAGLSARLTASRPTGWWRRWLRGGADGS